jgi:hypothetical protein
MVILPKTQPFTRFTSLDMKCPFIRVNDLLKTLYSNKASTAGADGKRMWDEKRVDIWH